MVAQTEQGNNPEKGKYERVHYITSRPFSEELQRLIDNPPLGSVPMEITPAMATEMLKRNDRNRPFSKSVVARYVALMRNGEWHNTRVPFIFSDAGRLIDGQHRGAACIESGVTITSDVIFGAEDQSFAFIDIGKRRTTGDIFAIHGVSNATMMAAAMALVYSYDHADMRGFSFGGMRRSSAELYDEYIKHPRLHDSIWVAAIFGKNRLASPSLMCALHYICARRCRVDADAFFRRLGEGVGITGARDPANVMRNKLIADMSEHEKMSRGKIGAMTLTAWNTSRAGGTIRQLKFYSDQAFPRAR